MQPSFGQLFGEPIPAYFVLLALGFALAVWLTVRWAKREGIDHEAILDLGLISALAGLVGARLLHVIADGYFWDYVHLCTDPGQVVWRTVTSAAECAQLSGTWVAGERACHAAERACFAWAAFWNGGLAYYGGLIAASATGLWFLRRERLPVLRVCDAVGAVMPIGLFFGRLGCFFGSCCFGKVTHGPLGLSFPPFSAVSEKQFADGVLAGKHLASLPVHPTQLYEAAGCLAIAALLGLWLQPRKRFEGQVMLVFLALYALLRFGLEYLRDDDRGAVLGLSTSQWIGVLVLAFVAGAMRRLSRASSADASARGLDRAVQ